MFDKINLLIFLGICFLLTMMSIKSHHRPPPYDRTKLPYIIAIVMLQFVLTGIMTFYIFWVPNFHIVDFWFLGLVLLQLLLFLNSNSGSPLSSLESTLMTGKVQDADDLFINYLNNEIVRFFAIVISILSNFTIAYTVFRVLVHLKVTHSLALIIATIVLGCRTYVYKDSYLRMCNV